MASWWLRRMLFALILLVPVELFEVPAIHNRLIKSLNLKLLRATEDASKSPNPSVYVGLRLSKEHNLEKESQYLQRLKLAFQPSASSIDMKTQTEASTGQLALYLLSLRASCEDLETEEMRKLVTRLKHKLHEEKKHIVELNSPITSYFQYSLGILALCVNHKVVDAHVIQKLLHAEEQKKFSLEGEHSVDTAAMAGLAFQCLMRSGLYTSHLTEKLTKGFGNIRENILQSQRDDGAFGNIYSTALALQVLIASKSTSDTECSKAVEILIESLKQGLFSNPMMMSQLTPVLHRKTYLDISTMDCRNEEDTLTLRSSSGISKTVISPEEIRLQLRVEEVPGLIWGYTTELQAPTGSSLLEVLTAAQKRDPDHFSFETEDTLYGPYLTTVNGLKSKQSERTYWKILKEPDVSIIEGIADYRPQEGETIILRLTKW
ncbi:transcobalamin-2 isoform X1 [Pleurodeles waltl]